MGTNLNVLSVKTYEHTRIRNTYRRLALDDLNDPRPRIRARLLATPNPIPHNMQIRRLLIRRRNSRPILMKRSKRDNHTHAALALVVASILLHRIRPSGRVVVEYGKCWAGYRARGLMRVAPAEGDGDGEAPAVVRVRRHLRCGRGRLFLLLVVRISLGVGVRRRRCRRSRLESSQIERRAVGKRERATEPAVKCSLVYRASVTSRCAGEDNRDVDRGLGSVGIELEFESVGAVVVRCAVVVVGLERCQAQRWALEVDKRLEGRRRLDALLP